MNRLRQMPLLRIGVIAPLGGCANGPIDAPITQVELSTGYRYDVCLARSGDTGKETKVIGWPFPGAGSRSHRPVAAG